MIDQGTIVKCDEQMRKIVEQYTPDNILNVDESSCPLNVLGSYSWHKMGDSVARESNEMNRKARLTMTCLINAAGRKVKSD